MVLSTMRRDGSDKDLTKQEIPKGMIRFAHKFEMDMVFGVLQHCINTCCSMDEIAEMDSVCDDAEWASTDTVVKCVAEQHAREVANGADSKADAPASKVAALSGPLLHKVLTYTFTHTESLRRIR